MQPKNWPITLQYSQVSVSNEMAIDILRALLFPPLEGRSCALIQEKTVHPHLEIRILTQPHPVATLQTCLGHDNRGLFAIKPIEEGEVLGEYTGRVQLISKNFGKQVKSGIADYLWTVEHPDFFYKVDGKFGTNELAMCNDFRGIQDTPNVEACFVPHNALHYFCFKTIKEIRHGEELLIDYGEQFFNTTACHREE
jgi:hypothetical protein